VRPETLSGKALSVGTEGIFIKRHGFKALYGICKGLRRLFIEKQTGFIFDDGFECAATVKSN